MDKPRLDNLPGFRRRFRITPGDHSVCCDVEDDYHCMSVLVRHNGEVATSVEPKMHRVPWTTCPGAEMRLREAFDGMPLAQFAGAAEKNTHCTHLYDLAMLAAAHALDDRPTVYDILVSDPINGQRQAELRKENEVVLSWVEQGLKIVAPEELKGIGLFDMKAWIKSLDPALREAAMLLRWGNILANGRSIPLEQQSDATRMPPNCYTFQPERAQQARRVGEIRDFSQAAEQPLAHIEIAL